MCFRPVPENEITMRITDSQQTSIGPQHNPGQPFKPVDLRSSDGTSRVDRRRTYAWF